MSKKKRAPRSSFPALLSSFCLLLPCFLLNFGICLSDFQTFQTFQPFSFSRSRKSRKLFLATNLREISFQNLPASSFSSSSSSSSSSLPRTHTFTSHGKVKVQAREAPRGILRWHARWVGWPFIRRRRYVCNLEKNSCHEFF